MTVIETGKSLRLENVLSLRKKMTQPEIQQELMKIRQYFGEKGLKKNGPVVTATFAVEQVDGQPLFDMEVLVPMDKQGELDGEYRLKRVFHLVNAVYARHEGNPNLLQGTLNEMVKYIKVQGLRQITAAYNVSVKELKPGDNFEGMVVDIYIGLDPSTL